MKFMLLAAEPPEDFALRDNKEEFDAYMGEWYAFSQEMASVTQTGAALETPQTATVVSVRDGKRHIQDGPYPDAKEQLGGFFIIDATDQQTAVQWGKKCPAAKTGYVDVHAVPYLEEGDLL